MQLLKERVLVKPLNQKKEISGILLPDSMTNKFEEGIVVAVGGGQYCEATGTTIPIDVELGSRVLFNKYRGNSVEIENEEHFIVTQREILGIIEED